MMKIKRIYKLLNAAAPHKSSSVHGSAAGKQLLHCQKPLCGTGQNKGCGGGAADKKDRVGGNSL